MVEKISQQQYALFPDPPSSTNHQHVFVCSFKCEENLDCALRGSISGEFVFCKEGLTEECLDQFCDTDACSQETIPNVKNTKYRKEKDLATKCNQI